MPADTSTTRRGGLENWALPSGMMKSWGLGEHCPWRLSPQHEGRSVSALMMHVCEFPPAITWIDKGNSTAVGISRRVVVPSTSWPEALRPQHAPGPSARHAQEGLV